MIAIIVFSRGAREAKTIPEPEVNTNLAAALALAKTHDPGTTLVISDGQPDNESAALREAESFRGAIDVLYIGPESNATAMRFMQRLAKTAHGEMRMNDISGEVGARALLPALMALLPAPS
jgi:hypothetical protein